MQSLTILTKEQRQQKYDTQKNPLRAAGGPRETGLLDAFFTKGYPHFDYRPAASPESQFKRLASSQGWPVESPQYREARVKFKAAYIHQFRAPIDLFFGRYPEFEYNPHAEAKSEFERLRQQKRWFEDGQSKAETKSIKDEYYEARREFFDAFTTEFTAFFGERGTVGDWVQLCDVLGVRKTPRTVEDCKEALKPYYVNIYDLLDHVRHKSVLIRYDNVEELSRPSICNDLLYPLRTAKTTCMKFLLREFVSVPGYKWDDWSRQLIPKEKKKGVWAH